MFLVKDLIHFDLCGIPGAYKQRTDSLKEEEERRLIEIKQKEVKSNYNRPNVTVGNISVNKIADAYSEQCESGKLHYVHPCE